MAKKSDIKAIAPMFVFFLMVNLLCKFFSSWLDGKGIDHLVLMGGNCILFFLSVFIFFIQKRALQNPNPNVFVRTMMGSTFIKLIVIAGSAAIYLLNANEPKSVYAVIACMGLYFIYTFIEVKTVSRINKENGRN